MKIDTTTDHFYENRLQNIKELKELCGSFDKVLLSLVFPESGKVEVEKIETAVHNLYRDLAEIHDSEEMVTHRIDAAPSIKLEQEASDSFMEALSRLERVDHEREFDPFGDPHFKQDEVLRIVKDVAGALHSVAECIDRLSIQTILYGR